MIDERGGGDSTMASECDQANHLWFCLRDYTCSRIEEFIAKLSDYIHIRNNRSQLILVHTAHPLFEYKDVLAEARRILAIFLTKSISTSSSSSSSSSSAIAAASAPAASTSSTSAASLATIASVGKTIDELMSKSIPAIAREHVETLLVKFLSVWFDCLFFCLFVVFVVKEKHLIVWFFVLQLDEEKRVVGFTALFDILVVLKKELTKEKNDEMKYSHFLCTLERANQDKLKLAIVQLKCVPCLNKFTTNFSLLSSAPSSSSSIVPTSTSSSNCSLMQSSSSSSPISCNSMSLSSTSGSNNTSKNMVSHANMSRLLKQMSLIVSTELQQIAIDLVERLDDEKLVKYIRLKDEFRYSALMHMHHHHHHHPPHHSHNNNHHQQQQQQQHAHQYQMQHHQDYQQQQKQNLSLQMQQQMKTLTSSFAKKLSMPAASTSSTPATTQSAAMPPPQPISVQRPLLGSAASAPGAQQQHHHHLFNPHSNLQQFMSQDKKLQELAMFGPCGGALADRASSIYTERFWVITSLHANHHFKLFYFSFFPSLYVVCACVTYLLTYFYLFNILFFLFFLYYYTIAILLHLATAMIGQKSFLVYKHAHI